MRSYSEIQISKKMLSITVLAVLLAFIVHYIVRHIDDFRLILNISPAYCFSIGVLYLGFFILNGLFFKVILKDFGINLNFMECTSISVLTSFGNAFIPFRGGLGIRAVYMKSKYAFTYTNSILTLAGATIITLNIVAILGLLTMLILYATHGYFSAAITGALAFMALASFCVIIFNPQWHKRVPFDRIRNKLDELSTGWAIIRKSPKNVASMYLLGIGNFLLCTLIAWLELMALGVRDMSGTPITYLQACFLSLISAVSHYVSITPASLGIREGLLMLTSNVVMISPSNVLMMSVLDRAVNYALLLILFQPATYCLKVYLKQKPPGGDVSTGGPGGSENGKRVPPLPQAGGVDEAAQG
jgi:uncharacterized membrane protein YbhN (UPF0104 family)